jgi:hypothetical protein
MIPDTTQAMVKWQGYFLRNYWLYWSQVWDLGTLAKRLFLCGLFGTRKLLFMSGESASLQPPSPSRVFLAFSTQVNQLSISFGKTSKPKEHAWGLLSSCTSFVRALMIVFIGNKLSLGKIFPRILLFKLSYVTFSKAHSFGRFKSSVKIGSLVMNNAMSQS